MGTPDEEGWVHVTSRRQPRQVKTTIYRSKTIDRSTCQAAREKILSAVTQVSTQAKGFLARILRKLRRYAGHGATIRIVALGMGSPSSLSMPLVRSFCYQFASCLILRELLKAENIEVFDPVMDVNDREVCNSLIRDGLPDLPKELHSLGTSPWDLDSDDEVASDNPGVNSTPTCVLLWMPHCEAELYKKVLLDLDSGIDPMASAMAMAGEEHTRPPLRHQLSNVVLVGNSLARYRAEKAIPRQLLDRVTESALPEFEPYHNAFSDSYVTEFRTLV